MSNASVLTLIKKRKRLVRQYFDGANPADLFCVGIGEKTNDDALCQRFIHDLKQPELQNSLAQNLSYGLNSVNLDVWKYTIKKHRRIASVRGMVPNKVNHDELTLFSKGQVYYNQGISKKSTDTWLDIWKAVNKKTL